jgi:hypothetical protein
MNFTIKELNELIYSLGITALNGRMLDKELNQSLMEKLHAELGYQLTLEAEDEEVEEFHVEDWVTQLSSDGSHFVSNEEADEDYRSTLVQDEERYEKSKTKPFDKSTSQCILDYVENTGASTYTELNEFYKFVTGGSNSFSHILKSLTIPYKNRKTQRYLVKEGFRGSNGKYVIKIANPSNWVEKSY